MSENETVKMSRKELQMVAYDSRAAYPARRMAASELDRRNNASEQQTIPARSNVITSAWLQSYEASRVRRD